MFDPAFLASPPPVDSAAADGPVAVILVAAGRGRRFGGGDNKVLLPLAGQPVWLHSVRQFAQLPMVKRVVMVIRPEDRQQVQPLAARWNVQLVDGGDERYDSVRSGLEAVRAALASELPDVAERALPWLVAVHDAARPLVSATDCQTVIRTATQTAAAVLAGPLRGTIKRLASGSGQVTTVDRSELWEAYTPQVFHLPVLLAAYDRWDGRPVTDDAELVERAGFPVTLVPGSAENLKITQPEDLTLAEALLSRRHSASLSSPPLPLNP